MQYHSHCVTVLLMGGVQQKRTPSFAVAVVGAVVGKGVDRLCARWEAFSVSLLFCYYIALVKRSQEAKERLIPLHSALVRQHLEYCVRFGGSPA